MICLSCRHCESAKLVRAGKSAGGKQRWLCRGCGRRSCENPYEGRPAEKEQQVVALLVERTSQRGIARALKLSRVTVADILKKRQSS